MAPSQGDLARDLLQISSQTELAESNLVSLVPETTLKEHRVSLLESLLSCCCPVLRNYLQAQNVGLALCAMSTLQYLGRVGLLENMVPAQLAWANVTFASQVR